MFKKVLAGLATMAVALGMVALTATPASAHHNSISAVITCTGDFKYQVDWKVTNSESLTETIISSSDAALVPPNTTTLGDKETKTFTEHFAAPTNKTLTLEGKWSNGNKSTDSGEIKKNQFPDCTPQHVPVTICHATPPDTAAQGWHSETVDDDAIVTSGHNQQHALDIIPVFWYWEKDANGVWQNLKFEGKNLDTSFSGISGSAILTAGCAYKATPTPPTFNPATCTAPGQVGLGSVYIPSTPGVRYEIRFGGVGNYAPVGEGTITKPVGTLIEVKAFGDPGWVGLNGTTYWPYTVGNPDPTDCIYISTPVFPDVTQITTCDQYGSVVPKDTVGVTYTFVVGDGKTGAWKLEATPAPGYKFLGDQVVYFEGDVGKYIVCVTPTEPGFVPSDCEGLGQQTGGWYTIPKKTGVVYEVKIGDDPWTVIGDDSYPVTVFPTYIQVRASAEEGYQVVGTKWWEYTFVSAGECLTKATPVEPTVVTITECGQYGSVTPVEKPGVVYTLTKGDGKSGAWEIEATPAEGYYFDGPNPTVYSGNLGVYTECAEADPATFADESCEPLVLELPQTGNGITAAMVGELIAGSYTIPETEGVQYTVSIDGGPFEDVGVGNYPVPNGTHVIVIATAKPGYTLEGVTEWEHTFVAYEGECDPPTFGEVFPSASATNQTCTGSGAIIVKPEPHVIYMIDGVEVTATTTPKLAGTYTVTAKTDSPEWGIFGPDEWVLTIAPAAGSCASGALAMTGSYLPILGLSAAIGLVVMGSVALAMRRRTSAE